MRRLVWISIALVASIAVGVTSSLSWALVAGLAILVIFQFSELLRFQQWAKRPLRRPDHDRTWSAGADYLHKLIRALRVRSKRLVGILRQLQLTTDSIPDGIVVVRHSGEIEYYNLGARTLLGLLPSDRGENLFALIRDPQAHSLMGGENQTGLVEFTSPVDTDKQIEMRRVALDEDRYIIIARDVTELNRLLTLRRDFVANISHELRTPLTVIIGYLETLTETDLAEEERRAALAKLVKPARRMQSLAEDLLTLTNLESSPYPDDSKVVGVVVARILATVVEEARNISRGAHELTLEADPSLVIEGVSDELFSAFHNLVINAVRYSPDGGNIWVRWYENAEGAVLEVEDEGIGIAEEHLSRLTERFYRVDLRGARVRGGTGLGLAIVKHVLRRHNTVLTIESRLGRGSKFSCVFPQLSVTKSE